MVCTSRCLHVKRDDGGKRGVDSIRRRVDFCKRESGEGIWKCGGSCCDGRCRDSCLDRDSRTCVTKLMNARDYLGWGSCTDVC
jgi:hypothetical protein